eukprot:Nitzschia sp. Nitz4//scaffold328_size19456//3374//4891//NITZ4_008717-RA/size19456-processed-gene-0.8-mRNA-1//1//CDS//3329547962//3899//frame0
MKIPTPTFAILSLLTVISTGSALVVNPSVTTATSTTTSLTGSSSSSTRSPLSRGPTLEFPVQDRVALSSQDAALRGGDDSAEDSSNSLSARLVVGFYFFAWYALNVVYNIVNKKVLNVLPAPLTVATIQLGVGAVYSALVWMVRLRAYPKLTTSGAKAVGFVGLYHCLGQLATVMSLGAGPVSFTHIVKALEPFFSAVLSGLYFQKWMRGGVYATLIPVVGGVSYACLKELNFSWLALSAAMASNIAFALRAIMSKLAMQSGEQAGTNLTPPNMFGVVTWAAFFISLPLCAFGEPQFFKLFNDAMESVPDKGQFIQSLLLSGLFHYLNNEVMYLALGKVHPVTLAVGNTMKRVFILVASVMVFQNPISQQAAIGSTVGIAGVLLYSLTKQYYEALDAKEAAAAASAATKATEAITSVPKMSLPQLHLPEELKSLPEKLNISIPQDWSELQEKLPNISIPDKITWTLPENWKMPEKITWTLPQNWKLPEKITWSLPEKLPFRRKQE